MKKILAIAQVLFVIQNAFAQERDSLAKRRFNDTLTLNEVTVTGKKQPVQVLPDKTVIHVDASVTNTGSTALEILERSPGITFDRNGNISIKGRQGVMIMIDGKPSQMSGGDLNNVLSAMTASQIETIEIIDNPGAQYDAAGNAGIINIRTRRNRQKGFNGNINSTVGQGRYFRTINSLSLNRYAGKLNVFGTLGVNDLRNFTDLYAFRTYFGEDGKTAESFLEQPSFFKVHAPSQNVKLGADYYVSAKTTVGFSASTTNFLKRSSGNNTAIWKNGSSITDSTIITTSNNNDRLRHAAANVNFRHRPSANSDLTADFDFLGYRIRNRQYFTNRLTDPPGYIENIRGELPSDINIFTAKSDYNRTFNKGWKWSAGWKSARVVTDNKADYQIEMAQGWQTDYGKTNHFIYKETIHAAYTSMEKQTGHLTIQGGIRYEATAYDAHQLGNSMRGDSSFSRKYDGLFPSGLVSIRADSANTFSLSAGRRIDRPPFQVLNPFVFIINKYTHESGNPYYRPQYTWNTELSHAFRNKLFTSITYSYTSDYFSQIFFADSSGIISYSQGNLDHMQNLGLSVSTQLSPYTWWSLSAQANVNYKQISGYVWERLNASLTQFNMNINNQFNFDNGWSAELSGFMQLREQELQEVTDPTGQLILGIAKQLFRNKGTIKFLLRDIFYTQAMKGNTIFNGAHEYFRITRDSRSASVAFVYRFGKPARSVQPRSGGASDEMQRVNTSG